MKSIPTPHENQITRLAYRVEDAAAAVGLSRSTIYELINSGKVRSVKVAGRRLIPADALEALVSVGAA